MYHNNTIYPKLIFFLFLLVILAGCNSPTTDQTQNKSRVLLAIFAHPDDESTISAVLAKYAAEGVSVHLAIATDGRYGITDHARIPAGDSLAAVRAGELNCAAEQLGINPPVMMGLHDQLKIQEGFGELNAQLSTLRENVTKLFSDLQPDAVLTWGPSGWTGHPDHRLVGAVVSEVFQSFPWEKSSQLFYGAIPTDQLPKESPFPVATVDSKYLTVKVPVNEADYEKARASLLCHKSQYTPEFADQLHQLVKNSMKGTVYFQPLMATQKERTTLF